MHTESTTCLQQRKPFRPIKAGIRNSSLFTQAESATASPGFAKQRRPHRSKLPPRGAITFIAMRILKKYILLGSGEPTERSVRPKNTKKPYYKSPVRSPPSLQQPPTTPKIPFLYLMLIPHLHHIQAQPLPALLALKTMRAHSSLAHTTFRSHLLSQIDLIQTPLSLRSAATSIANNSILKPYLSFRRTMHTVILSMNLSES